MNIENLFDLKRFSGIVKFINLPDSYLNMANPGMKKPTERNDTAHSPMDVFEAIHARRSVRRFLDVPVEWDKIGNIVDAGRVGPSAGNIQPVRYTIMRDPAKRKANAEACLQQFWMEQAPVHILITSEIRKARQYYGDKARFYIVQDAAMAAMSMMLAAHALGLSTCFVSAFDHNTLQRAIGFSDNAEPQGILCLGYADETPEPPNKYRIENVAGYEVWGTGMGGGGRVADDATLWNFRVVEKGINFVKEGASDMEKVTRTGRNNFLDKIKAWIEEQKEKQKEQKKSE